MTLVADPRHRLFEVDRRIAVANMILDGMLRGAKDGDLAKALEKAISDREALHGAAHYLIFERSSTIRELAADIGVDWISDTDASVQFRVADTAVPPTELHRIARDQLSAGIAALALASESLSGVSKAADSFVFYRDDGKPLYSFTPRMSGSMYLSKPIEPNALPTIESSFRHLSGDESLRRAIRLAVSSLDTSGDNLRAFLPAWAALEIFTHKTFRRYRPSKEQRPLLARFTVVAERLSVATAPADVATFKKAKGARDALFHGNEVAEAALPVEDVRRLFWKYVRLHVSEQQGRVRS